MRRSSEAAGVITFCGFGGVFISFAPAALASSNPMVEAAAPSTPRREGSKADFLRHMSHIGKSLQPLKRLHHFDTGDRLDGAGDLRRHLKTAFQLELDLGLHVEAQHER